MDAMTVSAARDEEAPDAGDLLLWILIWSELAAFGALLVAFAIVDVVQADKFAAARQHLYPSMAVWNTAVLVTSGWRAARAARPAARPSEARRDLVLAALLGFLFVGIKLLEYGNEIGHAADERFGAFFELYFLLTGFHLLHVLFGAFVLLLVSWRLDRPNLILITTLWHVFDLIWIVMFPLVYLA
ncbi:MAG: cytochrome c oxidase subunit 3 family protein [Mesorhizobium sp.]|uniref:cytochrome c oxidase subunit 3 n=1 Tax=Mesorhizobium sp. TaxID=1871066 RepID=UPI000FE5AC18|nr:cytochrome c oxidase subunit 3 [Mesorhizobium sp.]RWM07735.1 MAG: cytochrome c oxidase subunit 3 family protein [Mesorhizobium sp.]TIO52811.1 MAG: cytochrome c oxidase subunit 3 family protein [Mesorhizobium sp.]TIO59525.1 MAG: cytochrome c oxidase subunit 3 family protein [Mesorhizobium sp.]TJV62962.1 MAG: cytochrome c oxidase subunit 3 family protein [Mesorhizobium sp.]